MGNMIKISELKTSEYNPRKISEQELKKLEKSVKEFGFVVPVVINQNPERMNVVISGHQRIKIAEKLGMTEVPYMAVNLDITKERALNLALNKISGEFEEEQLTNLLMKIEEENEDVLSLTGFSTDEVNYLLGLAEKDKEKIFATSVEDPLNSKGNKYGIETGDIVVFEGKHKLICGDSTDPANFRKVLGDQKIDLLVTSPPYNVGKDYSAYNDNKEFNEYFEMIEKIFNNAKDFMDKTRYICVNIGKESGPINIMAEYHTILKKLNYHFFRNIYWLKPYGTARPTYTFRNPFPRMYSPALHTEMIEIYTVDELPKEFNSLITYKIGAGDDPRRKERKRNEQIPKILLSKYAGNVWEMQPETTLWKEDGIRHPAPFPVQLPFNCIRFFSFEGERIMDPFCGSGTSIIAADQLNRKGYGIELDPNYVSIAIERYLLYKPEATFEIIKGTSDKKTQPEAPVNENQGETQGA